MNQYWGIDLGGTKIEGVVLDAESEKVLARLRIPTEASKGYEHILQQIEQLILNLEEDLGTKRPALLGIGTPGVADPQTGRMKNCNTTTLNGRRLSDDLEQILGVRLRIANDANCFALAEAVLGAGRGSEVIFGVIMGTGVGGGLVVHGHVLPGVQGIAGEWGHNVLEPDGDPCYCGKTGCVETVLSGPALERYYQSLSGERKSLPEIARLAPSDPHAAATVDRLVSKFGEAIATVINIVDPDVIVLGGGVGNVPALFERAHEAMSPWVFNDSPATKIRRPALGDSAGVFGAAMLVSKASAVLH